MSSAPRLFVTSRLIPGEQTLLDEGQGKYLTRVMRLNEGDEVRCFDGQSGEWRCHIRLLPGKKVAVEPDTQTREQVEALDLTLLFAPLKKARTDFVVEKASELGVRLIQPVMTERTQSSRVRGDRLQAVVIEAAEQTERLDIPEVADDVTLMAALDQWDRAKPLYYCDEAGDARPMAEAVAAQTTQSAGLLIGPEGGFSPNERKILRGLDFVVPVTLGPRILRAETAVVSALTLWQSLVGDWRSAPYLPSS